MQQIQVKSTRVIVAVLVAMAAVLVFSVSGAQAVAPTLAPIISDSPSDPATTGPATFEIGPDPADAGDVTQIQCRVAAADPSSYRVCWSPEDGDSATYIVNNVPNGAVTFLARSGDDSGGFGPVATYNWTQNLPAPTAAPVFTETPDDINTEMPANFAFKPGPGDEDKVASFQCRIDSDNPADFTPCNKTAPASAANTFPFGTRAYWRIGQGSHTFDVRAKTDVDTGPIASHTWTNDVPSEINPSVELKRVKITQWNGGPGNGLGTPSDGFDPLQNAGDINGDGRNDLLAGAASGMNEVLVLFSTEHGLGDRSITSFGPALGYAMTSTAGTGTFQVLGDLNGDGVSDFAVPLGSSGTVAVAYGVADPARDLPKCVAGPAQKRCLGLDNLTDDQGYYINAGPGATLTSAGDFDGDGLGDIQIVTPFGPQEVLVIKGGVRTGTVDPGTLPADETFKAVAASPFFFGAIDQSVGDLNADGKDDIYVGNPSDGSAWIINGRAFGSPTLDLSTGFNQNEGLVVANIPFGFALARNVGDINGDGRPDLTFAGGILSTMNLLYMPQQPTDDPVIPEGGENGYSFSDPGNEDATGHQASAFATVAGAAGDFNNDGVPDQIAGIPGASHGAEGHTGVGYIMFGQRPGPESGILGVGADLTPDSGVAVLGEDPGAFGGLGTGAVALGDVTGDGVGDFAFADGRGDGKVYIVSGGRILAHAKLGRVTGISEKSATLNAAVVTTGRDTEIKFEYGTSDEYGSETASQTVPGSGNATPIAADLTGLSATTTYHYRAVAKNELGLTRYGADRSFTTAQTPPPEGCEADSTLPGCPDYDYCQANPEVPACQPPAARLSRLIVAKAQRGKRAVVRATIINTGNAPVSALRVCAQAPKRLVRIGKRCMTQRALAPGQATSVKFRMRVRWRHRRVRKVKVRLAATAAGLGRRNAVTVVRAR